MIVQCFGVELLAHNVLHSLHSWGTAQVPRILSVCSLTEEKIDEGRRGEGGRERERGGGKEDENEIEGEAVENVVGKEEKQAEKDSQPPPPLPPPLPLQTLQVLLAIISSCITHNTCCSAVRVALFPQASQLHYLEDKVLSHERGRTGVEERAVSKVSHH